MVTSKTQALNGSPAPASEPPASGDGVDSGGVFRLRQIEIDSGPGAALVAASRNLTYTAEIVNREGGGAVYAETRNERGDYTHAAVVAVTGRNNALLCRSEGDVACAYIENRGSGYDVFAAGDRPYGRADSIRLKHDVHPLTGALETIRQLAGVRFTWKKSGLQDVGFVAEHVAQHLPEAVVLERDGSASGMSYDTIVPVLVEAIKELDARMTTGDPAAGGSGMPTDLTPIREELGSLKATIDGLETRLAALEGTAGELAAVQADLTALGAHVGAVGQAVSGLAAENATVRTELGNVRARLDQVLAAPAAGGPSAAPTPAPAPAPPGPAAVKPAVGANIAPNAKPTAGETLQNGGPENLNDGKLDNFFDAWSKNFDATRNNAFVQLEWPEAMSIGLVRIWGRGGYEDRISGSIVTVTDAAGKTVYTSAPTTVTGREANLPYVDLTFQPPVSGKILRMTGSSDNRHVLNVGEIQVFTPAVASPRPAIFLDSGSEGPGPKVVDESLVLELPLNEIVNNTVRDAQGRSFALTGASMVPDERFGSALYFNGASSIDCGSDGSFSITADMTIEAWVYPQVGLHGRCLISRHYVGEYDLTFWSDQPHYYHGAGGGYHQTAGPAVKLDRWTHLAMVRRVGAGTQVTFFVDGVAAAPTTLNSVPPASAHRLSVGHRINSGSQPFQGRIARLRIYKRALDPAEIQQHMALR